MFYKIQEPRNNDTWENLIKKQNKNWEDKESSNRKENQKSKSKMKNNSKEGSEAEAEFDGLKEGN